MSRLWIPIIVAVAALYVLVSSIFVVNERQQAIVMRFGQITDVKTEPGLYFKIPTDFIDTVQLVEDRLLRYDEANMTVQVRGGKLYEVDAFLTYRINNPRLFRQAALGDLTVAENRIGSLFQSALRQVYAAREFDAALSEARAAMMREARDLIVPTVAELGIQVVDVRILRTDLSQDVSVQTFELMKAERLAEAEFLRARGRENAQRIRAVANRQAVEIEAEAQRASEILRGEGDAQRSATFAAAYGQDPEFFQFYRSMLSYQAALGANSGTTMLLSPDSEFFQYFGQDSIGGEAPPPAVPGGIAPPAFTELGEIEPSVDITFPEPAITTDVAPETAPADVTTPPAVDEGSATELSLEPAPAETAPAQ
jgi:membrane protease subunit HflC